MTIRIRYQLVCLQSHLWARTFQGFQPEALAENLGKFSADAVGLELIFETTSQIFTNIIQLEVDPQ